MGEDRTLVTVYVSQGPLAAEVAKGKLETAGIPVLLRYEAIGRILGITVDGLGRVEVQVPAQFEAQACEILEEMEASSWLDDAGSSCEDHDGTP